MQLELLVACRARSRKTCKRHKYKTIPRTTCMTMGRQVQVEVVGRKAYSEAVVEMIRHEIASVAMPRPQLRAIAAVRVSSRSIGSGGTPSESE